MGIESGTKDCNRILALFLIAGVIVNTVNTHGKCSVYLKRTLINFERAEHVLTFVPEKSVCTILWLRFLATAVLQTV